MKLSLILEARSNWKRVIDGTRRSLGGVDRDARKAAGGIGAMDRSAGRSTRTLRTMERAAFGMGMAIGSATRRGIGGLMALERRLTLTNAQMKKMAFWSGRKLGGGIRTAATLGGAGLAAGGLAAAYKVASAGMEFERYRTQLRGLEGSLAAGNKAMDWVADFARTTPYEIDQVMEAFIALKAYGIDPTDGSLRTLGDTAAGMGKGLMQAVEMIADAQTGEFERLKEFGIRASMAGQKVTFSFMRSGKTMTRTVKKDGAEIQRTLMQIFGERFGGGMDRLAQTTAGKWSNVMDRITFTAKRVWEGGIGDAVNKVLDDIGTNVDKMEADGSLKKWADESGKSVGKFILDVRGYNWKGLAKDIGGVAGAFRDIASAVAGAGDGLNWLGDAASKGGLISSQYNPLLSDEAKYKNRQRLRVVNQRMGYDPDAGIEGWKGIDRAIDAQAAKASQAMRRDAADYDRRRSGGGARPSFSPDAAMPSWTSPAARGKRTFQPSAPFPSLAPRSAIAPAKPAPPAQGKVSIDIRTQPGTTATPTAVSAKGMQLQVRTGPAMAGPA